MLGENLFLKIINRIFILLKQNVMKTIEELREIEVCDFDLSELTDEELTLLEQDINTKWENTGEVYSLGDYHEIVRELTRREFDENY